MRLTNLEIKGFKSFADKTVINFNDSITGIVGPNGCGKSNIVDAVRWVLGEQKTTMLRSDKMENIIFNGSKGRKPANFSEVSMTFENTKNLLPTEYNTVTISRTLTRDGESEYRLNSVPCRLKDITLLLLDTGISSDSYAIIELGMVNEILNDVDNSRRRLFEQAAGISKYKARKKETLNKLNLTETDLSRVQDLLFEIETNLKSLETQAKKTQKYYQLKEEYKNISIEWAITSLSTYKESYAMLHKRQDEENDKKLELETVITQLESNLEQQKGGNIAKEQLLASVQRELNHHIDHIRQQENEKNIFTEKLKFLRERNISLRNQVDTANQYLSLIRSEIEKLNTDSEQENTILQQMDSELEILRQELATIKENYSAQKPELEKFQQEYQSNEKRIFELEKKTAVNSSQQDGWQKELQQIEEDTLIKENEFFQLNQSLTQLEENKTTKEKTVTELVEHEEKISEKISSTELSIEQLREQISLGNRKLDAKRNEYNLTKSLVDNLEGFPESIKFLKKNLSWAKNAPLLSDIISCKEEYRASIENLLEPYLNYYVVDNLQEAIAAINLLNEASKGKANFFILNEIPERNDNSNNSSNSSNPVFLSAMNIIETESKYKRLCEYLLNNVFIVDDTTGFSTDNLKSEDGKVLITKSGKFVRSKYTLSGGSVGLFEGKKIGRAKNLEILHQEIEATEKNNAVLNEQLTELQELLQQTKNSSLKTRIEQERNNLNQLSNEYFSLQAKIENLQTIIQSNSNKKISIRQQMENIGQENINLNQHLDELKKTQEVNSGRIKILEEEFVKINAGLNQSTENFNQKNIQFIQQQNKVNSLRQLTEYKQQQVNDNNTQILQNTATMETTEEEISATENKLKELESALLHLYEEQKQKEENVRIAEDDYYKSKSSINQVEHDIREKGKVKEQVTTLLNEIHDKINNLKLELTSLKERLAIEFKVDIDTILDQEKTVELSEEELKEKVERLKNRLDNYGEINPMAVEAFNEMKERYDFITAQKNDLENAKTSLLQTITEIESTATEHFMTAFNKVRENFQNLFRNLFEEQDECDLILLDPNNPLESKLEIIAKPKGKKPLTINQLSGGEQTLTAISLLFSLYLLKPAPFCIFDEVDAPLDDINIGKFNKIIQQFAKESQFVIVTHNKQTMAAVDIIYGVTMADEGVSRVVPVDFRSLN